MLIDQGVRTKPENFDIHDRVNYAVEKSFLRVNEKNKEITLELTIDTEISKPMEIFEIFYQEWLCVEMLLKF